MGQDNNIDKQLRVLLHELSNPLTIASSLVEIMLNDPSVEKLSEVHESLNRMIVTVKKLKELNTK